MHHIDITGHLPGDKTIKIIPENWVMMGKGQGHIILSNKAVDDELYFHVLSICIHQLDSLPPEFQEAYQDILKHRSKISQSLIKRELIRFENSQLERFKKMVEALYHIDLKEWRVHLSENLKKTQKQWDFYIQFKPKTPLPDIYSLQFLTTFCSKHNLSLEKLKTALDNSPPEERLRWFKKSAFKQQVSNMNALAIFLPETHEAPPFITKMEPLTKKTEELIDVKHKINNQQISKSLQNSGILDQILKMQLLYVCQTDFREIDFYQIWNDPKNKAKDKEKALQSIIKELQQFQHPYSLLKDIYGVKQTVEEQVKSKNDFEKILRFLVSWSWRDISLMMRLKLDKQREAIEESEVHVIDYELKEASKLKQTIEKDEKFLLNYLKWKKVL